MGQFLGLTYADGFDSFPSPTSQYAICYLAKSVLLRVHESDLSSARGLYEPDVQYCLVICFSIILVSECRPEGKLKDLWMFFVVVIMLKFCIISNEMLYHEYIFSVAVCSNMKMNVSDEC